MVTKGYGGHKYSKSVRVETNDPKHAKIELKLSGDIKTFATIIPKSVYLNEEVGESLSQHVKIIPETDKEEIVDEYWKTSSLNKYLKEAHKQIEGFQSGK